MLSCRQGFGSAVPDSSPPWAGEARIIFQLPLVSCLSLTKITPRGVSGVSPGCVAQPLVSLWGSQAPCPTGWCFLVVLKWCELESPHQLGALGHQNCWSACSRQRLCHSLPQGDGDSWWFGETRWPRAGLYMEQAARAAVWERQAVLERHVNWVSVTVTHNRYWLNN